MKKNNRTISTRQKILCYLQASRIEGGIIASVFLLLGMWYANQDFPIYKSILGIFAINCIVNAGSIVNYVFDKEIDTIAGKDTGFYEYISTKEMLMFSLTLSIVGIILLFYINLSSFILGLILFIVFFIYAIPPIRLKTLPPIDCFINALGFGSIPFLLGWGLFGELPRSIIPLYGSVICGLVVTSYYLLISSFDIESDKEAKIKTSCTILGFNRSIIVGASIFFIALCSALLLHTTYRMIIIILLICTPIVISMIVKRDLLFIQKTVSIVYLLWTGSALLILFILSRSVIPIALFIILLLISMQVIIMYVKTDTTDKQ